MNKVDWALIALLALAIIMIGIVSINNVDTLAQFFSGFNYGLEVIV